MASMANEERQFREQGEHMMQTAGASVSFIIERTPEAIAREEVSRPGPAGLSGDAMHFLERSMIQWVGSRIWRRVVYDNKSTHKVEIELTVKIDGEEIDPQAEVVTFTLPDASHRQQANDG